MRRADRRSASLASMAALMSCETRSWRLMRRSFLEVADGVAHLRGLLVILVVDRFREGVFEFLPLGHGTQGAHLVQPILQPGDFTALFEQISAAVQAIKLANTGDATLDLRHRGAVILGFERLGGMRARVDHQKLRTKLLQRPGKLLVLGVFLHEVEDGEVALGVADDGGVVLQLQLAIVPVVILKSLKLKFDAIRGREFETGVVASIGGEMLVELGLIMFVKGGVAERTLAVGPALGIHLKDAEIDSQLNLFGAVLADELADGRLA